MKKFMLAAMILSISALLISSAWATLTPATFSATLNPGQSASEDKSVFMAGTIPKGDVMFAFDCTGSMSDTIDEAKADAIAIMTGLSSLISDAQFGVISFMDYPGSYDSYGYSATYGVAASGDYAYKLNQPLSSNTGTVSTAINGLYLGYGADNPQDYTRILYESYADTNIAWRAGAKRILILFGDNVPHDNNLNEGVPSKVGVYSTGGDPGRDEVMFTADDLDLQTVLAGMATNNVVLLFVGPSYAPFDYWNYWTGITGGNTYSTSDPSQIPTAIQTLVGETATHIHKLTLEVEEAGYTSWLTGVVPSEYDEFDIPTDGITKGFSITFTVPLSTVPGTYIFHVSAVADGASYGEQEVTIFVPPTSVIPEVPIGTIVASALMALGLFAYIGVPRFTRARKL